MLNAAASLKLDKVLREGMRALERRLSPVLALSTVMRNEVLTETNTIQVPFYPLETLASKNFDGSYEFDGGDANLNAKNVTVNKRKYQALSFTSKELARNSVVDLNRVLQLKIEKLAEDVLDDVWSVFTAADYGAAIFTGAASGFDRDDLADVRTDLNQAHWPQAGRSLILESDYEGALIKDLNTVGQNGTEGALRQGSTGRLLGFDLFDHPNMPTNGENLVGMALLPYAACVAFAPIEPAEEVRHMISDYRKFVGKSGLTMEYRAWGDPDSDRVKRTIEVNYGYAKGDTAQGKRFVSA